MMLLEHLEVLSAAFLFPLNSALSDWECSKFDKCSIGKVQNWQLTLRLKNALQQWPTFIITFIAIIGEIWAIENCHYNKNAIKELIIVDNHKSILNKNHLLFLVVFSYVMSLVCGQAWPWQVWLTVG